MKADGVGQFASRYRAAWKALGRDEAKLPLIGLSRHVVVGDTDKEAQSAAKRAFALWYDALIHLWRAHGVGLPRQMIPAEFEPALERRLHHRRIALDGARAAEARQRDCRHQLLHLPAGLRRSVVRGVEALGRAVRQGSDAGALSSGSTSRISAGFGELAQSREPESLPIEMFAKREAFPLRPMRHLVDDDFVKTKLRGPRPHLRVNRGPPPPP